MAVPSYGMGGETTQDRPSGSGLIESHLGVLASGLVLIWLATRVLSVAQGNRIVALAILSSAGPVDVALGVLTTSFGSLTILLILGLQLARRRILHLRGEVTLSVVILASLEVVLALLAIFYIATGSVILYLLAYFIVLRIPARFFFRDGSDHARERLAFGIIGFGLLAYIFIITPGMWLPPESLTIDTDQGPEVAVGYVLSENPDAWLSYLRVEPRTVERVKSADVLEREICGAQPAIWFRQSVAQLTNSPILPECPTLEQTAG